MCSIEGTQKLQNGQSEEVVSFVFQLKSRRPKMPPPFFFWIAFAFVSVSSLEPVQGRRTLQQVPPARAPRSVDGPLGQLACSALTITGLYYRTKRSILQRSSLASGL